MKLRPLPLGAAVGIVSAITQGLLLGRLLKRFSPQRLAALGLVSSTLAYAMWGAATRPSVLLNKLAHGEVGRERGSSGK